MVPRRSLAALGISTVLIIGTFCAVIAWILNTSTASLDRMQTQGENTLLRTVANDYKGFLALSIADYTAWTELYRYLNGPPDANWEKANLGPYVARTFSIDGVFIVSRKGRIAYAYQRRFAERLPADFVSDQQTIRMLARLAFRSEIPDVQVPAAGFTRIGGMPALVAASTIRDSSVALPSRFALVEIRLLTPQLLSGLGIAHNIHGLRVGVTGEGTSLQGPDGKVAEFTLAWRSSRAGEELLGHVLPVMLFVGFLAVGALFFVAFMSYRLASQLKARDQRLLETELESNRMRADTAEELSRSKSAFIANMSHELRTPLNAIIGFSELMQTQIFGPLSMRYRGYLDDIHSSGSHLLEIVNAILQLSKLDAGKTAIDLREVSLRESIIEVQRIATILADKKNIRLNADLENTTIFVMADQQALKQVLLNLISNAIKFSPVGSSVEVFAEKTKATCAIYVRDQGCGIPPDTVAKLGQPFVQAESAFSRQYQGTGLGLAISFSLARQMDAALEIESTPNIGTTVKLSFKRSLITALAANAA